MIAAICKDKNGADIITLKCEPAFGEQFRKTYEAITPGYYMNKTHWNSVRLDSDVPKDVVDRMIQQSYDLIVASLSKKYKMN